MCNPIEIDAPRASGLQLWAGLECTVNRVGNRYFDQVERTGHASRADDLDRIASLGVQTCRYPFLWERIAPNGLEQPVWQWQDERASRLRELGIAPIAGLVHHGSGPRYTCLIDPRFPEKLASYARMVAERYPWIDAYTPVNEPLTTARCSGLYGHWYPHGRDDLTFVRCLLSECRGTVLAMRAVRDVNPSARLVQTEDLGKVHGTDRLRYQCEFENERRWLTWDLLCGRVDDRHPMWTWLLSVGTDPSELEWFLENPCPPDVLGVNYYVTSERFLDDEIDRYPDRVLGGNGRHRYADIEAVRVRAEGLEYVDTLLKEAWERYALPIAITEAHLACTREEQARWLIDIWNSALAARAEGTDVRAVTIWTLFGAYDWDCLVTASRGCYEPGVFDVRSSVPRETALARVARSLAAGQVPSEPALDQPGWWRRRVRFVVEPRGRLGSDRELSPTKPLLIVGGGTLGRAFARLCDLRGLPYCLMRRAELDITHPASASEAIAELSPWAVVNTAGYVRVDDAEEDIERCMAENAKGPAVLADACDLVGCPLVTFSSDLVFDGTKETPYVEDDAPNPLNVYGRSKLLSERMLAGRASDALIVRTAAFFGPWDQANFLWHMAARLAKGKPFEVHDPGVVSPTYVPDLVNVTLDLLIDGERGLWHLTNEGAVTWQEFARMACEVLGLDDSLVVAGSGDALRARRPANSALASSRARLMPSLADALSRFGEAVEREPQWALWSDAEPRRMSQAQLL